MARTSEGRCGGSRRGGWRPGSATGRAAGEAQSTATRTGAERLESAPLVFRRGVEGRARLSQHCGTRRVTVLEGADGLSFGQQHELRAVGPHCMNDGPWPAPDTNNAASEAAISLVWRSARIEPLRVQSPCHSIINGGPDRAQQQDATNAATRNPTTRKSGAAEGPAQRLRKCPALAREANPGCAVRGRRPADFSGRRRVLPARASPAPARAARSDWPSWVHRAARPQSRRAR